MDLDEKKPWERSAATGPLVELFNNYSQQAVSFFSPKMNDQKKIGILDFITNDKTIIIDLSKLHDPRLKSFSAFLLLAKISHLIQNIDSIQEQQELRDEPITDYQEKVLVVPHVDMMFDAKYLYKNRAEWKINQLLEPLRREGFGLLFSANEVSLLHQNTFKFFTNYVSFKATQKADLAVLKNLMSLQELHGTGYYSSRRNNSYQTEYLMNQKPDEVLVRRSDINQPFPGRIHFLEGSEMEVLEPDDIFNHMKEQGYDLRGAERELMGLAKKTLFEKDLGHRVHYLDEIIKFFKNIKKVDKIGNLYKSKIKTQLMEAIYKKARMRTNDKRKLTKIRDDLLELLIRHDYLVEKHPKSASGGESIAVSHAAGPKYDLALDDYFETMKGRTTNVAIETIRKQKRDDRTLQGLMQEKKPDLMRDLDFVRTLSKAMGGNILINLSRMNNAIQERDFEKVILMGKDAIKNFLIRLKKASFEHNVRHEITPLDLDSAINYLSGTLLSRETLVDYLKKCSMKHMESSTEEEKAMEMWNIYNNFYETVKKRITEGT